MMEEGLRNRRSTAEEEENAEKKYVKRDGQPVRK
jgi:hypothetical protein